MPSERRRFLQTLPMGIVGLAGCSSLQPNEREDDPRATSSAGGESPLYEPTTPGEDDARTPTAEPEYVVQTPVTIFVRNHRKESQSVRLTLELEPPSEASREARNRTYEVQAGETLKIGEFEQNGQYHFTAETDEERYEETTYVSMRSLADCNSISAGIVLEESGITLGGVTTDVACPPVTATPEPSGGG